MRAGVAEAQALEGVAEVGVGLGVGAVEAGEDEGFGLAVAGERLDAVGALRRDGVAGGEVMGVLEAGGDVADVAGSEDVLLAAGGDKDADIDGFGLCTGLDELEAVGALELAVNDADVGHHALVLIVGGVEDEGAEGGVWVTGWRRGLRDDSVEEVADAVAGLGGDAEDFRGVGAEEVGQFAGNFLGAGGGKVGLVDDGDYGQVEFEGGVGVGEGLGFDALGGVDKEYGAFAGGEGAGDLVAEVHVAGGVDQVEGVLDPSDLVAHVDRVGLDSDAALAFEVHGVEDLLAHLAPAEGGGEFQHAVGQGGFAVVDVGDDAEVTGACLGRGTRLGHG